MSKTKFLFAILLVSLSAGAAYFFLGRPRSNSLPSIVRNHPPKKHISVPTSQLISQAVQQPIADAAHRTKNDCTDSWTQTAAEDFETVLKRVAAGELKTSPKCRESERKTFQFGSADLSAAECKKTAALFEARKKDANLVVQNDNCTTKVMMYRAQVIDELSEGFADLSRLEPTVLINKLWSRTMRGKIGAEDKAQNLAIADALIAKQPDVYGAHKFKVLVHAMDAATSKNSSDATLDAFERAIENCEAFDLSDPELTEAEMLVHNARDPQQFREYLSQELEHDPTSPTLRYFQASTLWKDGDRTGAVAILNQLVAQNPKDTRARDTLQKSKTAKPGEKIFNVQLSFRFDKI